MAGGDMIRETHHCGQCVCWSEMHRMDNWNPYGAGPRQFGSIVPGVLTV